MQLFSSPISKQLLGPSGTQTPAQTAGQTPFGSQPCGGLHSPQLVEQREPAPHSASLVQLPGQGGMTSSFTQTPPQTAGQTSPLSQPGGGAHTPSFVEQCSPAPHWSSPVQAVTTTVWWQPR